MLKPGLYIAALGLVGLALLVVLLGDGWERFPSFAYGSHLESHREGGPDSLRRARFSNGTLWLLSDSGRLWTVDEATSTSRPEPLPAPALDVCVHGESVAVVTTPSREGATWTLRTRTGRTGWVAGPEIRARNEGTAALLCDQQGFTLLTSQRLISWEAGRQRVVRLSQRLPTQGVNTVLVRNGELFIGVNLGEWGGGLWRVDRRSGSVTAIERNISGDTCGGPLNTECDPVHGIVSSPWKPGCVLATVGLQHMGVRGRLVEVCGDAVRRIYLGPCPYGRKDLGLTRTGEDEPSCSEAFSGLAVEGGELVMVGTNGVTRLDRRENVAVTPLPDLSQIDPFQIAFGPDMILVESSFNRRSEMGSTPPTLVSRPEHP